MAASGECAPASALTPERLNEPLAGYDEKNEPARLASPWPMNSWLPSSAVALARDRARDRHCLGQAEQRHHQRRAEQSCATVSTAGRARQRRHRPGSPRHRGERWPARAAACASTPRRERRRQCTATSIAGDPAVHRPRAHRPARSSDADDGARRAASCRSFGDAPHSVPDTDDRATTPAPKKCRAGCDYQHGRARREADDHRVRHEVDQAPSARQPEQRAASRRPGRPA